MQIMLQKFQSCDIFYPNGQIQCLQCRQHPKLSPDWLPFRSVVRQQPHCLLIARELDIALTAGSSGRELEISDGRFVNWLRQSDSSLAVWLILASNHVRCCTTESN